MMADIDIVPRMRSSTWLWVVLALIVLAVIFWLVAGGTRPETSIGALDEATAAPVAAAIAPST